MLIGSSHLGTMTQQSIAWDITSALYSNKSFNFNSVDSQGKSIRFDPTGKIMFLAGAGADKVYEFALSVAWDISTAVYSSKFLSVAGETTLMEAMEVSADGTKVYAADKGGVVYQYTLTSAWDISTASYSSKSLDTSGRTTTIKGCTISSDGTKFYVCDPFTNDVDQYNLSTPYDLSTGSYASKTVDLDSEDAVIQGVFLGNTDATLFVSGDTANAIPICLSSRNPYQLPVECDRGRDGCCQQYERESRRRVRICLYRVRPRCRCAGNRKRLDKNLIFCIFLHIGSSKSDRCASFSVAYCNSTRNITRYQRRVDGDTGRIDIYIFCLNRYNVLNRLQNNLVCPVEPVQKKRKIQFHASR